MNAKTAKSLRRAADAWTAKIPDPKRRAREGARALRRLKAQWLATPWRARAGVRRWLRREAG